MASIGVAIGAAGGIGAGRAAEALLFQLSSKDPASLAAAAATLATVASVVGSVALWRGVVSELLIRVASRVRTAPSPGLCDTPD